MSKKHNFPESWDVKKTGEVGELVHGHQFRSNDFCDEDGIPVLKIGSITNRGVELSESDDIPSAKLGEYEEYKIEDNTPLIALSGATWGKTAYFDSYKKPVLQNYRVGKVTTDDLLNPVFTYQYLSSEHYQDQLKGFVARQAQENIGKSDFELTEIPVPPLAEQRRIASVLHSVDEQLRTLTDRHDSLSELKHGLIQDLVIGKRAVQDVSINDSVSSKPDPTPDSIDDREYKETRLGAKSVKVPESWNETNLKSLNDEENPICYGVLKPKEHTEDGYPLVKIENLKSEILDMNQDFHCISEERHNEYSRSKISGGELLMSIQGTIGRTCVVPEGVDANISRTVAKITPSDKLNPYYLKYYLKHNSVKALINVVSTGSTRSSFNIEDIREFPVLLPPLWEQERIASILYTVDEMIARTSDLIDEYERLKRGLMQDLLSGDFRTPEDLNIMDEVKGDKQ